MPFCSLVECGELEVCQREPELRPFQQDLKEHANSVLCEDEREGKERKQQRGSFGRSCFRLKGSCWVTPNPPRSKAWQVVVCFFPLFLGTLRQNYWLTLTKKKNSQKKLPSFLPFYLLIFLFFKAQF